MIKKPEIETLSIIPARGGSKGIPKKNIIDINGRPLIDFTIDIAKKSDLIDRIIVSTDSLEIANIAKECGAEVPFIRPAELATDDSTIFPVIKHAIEWLVENEKYKPDLVVLLEPTFPIRSLQEIDKAIQLIISDEEADSLRGVCESFQNPYKMWIQNGKYLEPLIKGKKMSYEQPRQKLQKVYWQNGYIHISKYKTITEKGSFAGDKIIPFIVNKDKFIDIDAEEDLQLLKNYLKNSTSE